MALDSLIADAVSVAHGLEQGSGVDAIYTAVGGSPQAVTAYLLRQDPELNQRISAPGWLLGLKVAEIATKPTEGALAVIAGTTYRIRGIHEAPGLWVCDVDQVIP